MLVLLGCTDPDAPSHTSPPTADTVDVTVTPAVIGSVLVADWSTEEETPSRVEATFGDETLVFEDATAATEHHLILTGFPALTEVEVAVVEGGAVVGTASAETRRLPDWVPDLTFTADTPDAAQPGLTLLPVVSLTASGVVAVDGDGRVVWYFPPDDSGSPVVFRARPAADGKHILINRPSTAVDINGGIASISLDGTEVIDHPIMGGHTDFVETTPGVYASLGWDLRTVDGRKVLGDRLIERTEDGTEREVWNVWDWFEPDLTRSWPHFYASDPEVEDWSHINGLAYVPDEDAYYVTMTFNDGVAKIDRQSGELVWVMSAEEEADIQIPPDTILAPHSVQRLEDGLLVFARGEVTSPDGISRAVEVALDEEAGEARAVWSYATPDELLVTALGSAQRLPNGNTLVSWSTSGRASEVTPDGEIAWQVSTSIGSAFGFAERVEYLSR